MFPARSPGPLFFIGWAPEGGSLAERCTMQTFTTVRDDQTEMCLMIYEGSFPKASKNRLLGQFQLVNIPPAPVGVPRVQVNLAVPNLPFCLLDHYLLQRLGCGEGACVYVVLVLIKTSIVSSAVNMFSRNGVLQSFQRRVAAQQQQATSTGFVHPSKLTYSPFLEGCMLIPLPVDVQVTFHLDAKNSLKVEAVDLNSGCQHVWHGEKGTIRGQPAERQESQAVAACA